MSSELNNFRDPFEELKSNTQFWLDVNVPRVKNISSIEFLRRFVMKKKPCVIQGAIDHWPALLKWTDDYLSHAMNRFEVSVAATPNGRADDVVKGQDGVSRFVQPETRKMLFSDFLNALGDDNSEDILYCQAQNNSMKTEYQALLSDIEKDLPLATEAFGLKPDAVNFWMGEDRSVSSLHQDPYENMYCVVRGKKFFTLLPPTIEPWLAKPQLRTARWAKTNSKWEVVDDECEGTVPWVTTNPDELPNGLSPIKVSVRKGETLYLPALWYHQVSQKGEEGRTVAVNFWYDMVFDSMSNVLLEFFKMVAANTKTRNE